MTRRFDAVLFDLDGTLLDTLEDLADSMNAALAQMGLPTHGVEPYRQFVGDGVDILAKRVLPAQARDATTVAACVAAMRVHYERRWHAKTRPYDGIEAALSALAGQSMTLAVLSNKPDDFTRIMVEHYFPACPFAVVRGALPDVPRKPDPAPAVAIARELNVPPCRWAYVGDTNTDMRTAVSAGMFAIGVTWGFRDRQELADNGAAVIIDRPDQLPAVIAG